jgi:hypothetical protein
MSFRFRVDRAESVLGRGYVLHGELLEGTLHHMESFNLLPGEGDPIACIVHVRNDREQFGALEVTAPVRCAILLRPPVEPERFRAWFDSDAVCGTMAEATGEWPDTKA